MPTRTKTAAAPVTTDVKAATAAFDKTVEQALKQFHDPRWLAEHSPLASPYFLGDELFQTVSPNQPTIDQTDRGHALQQLLRAAATTMAQQQRRGQSWLELLEASYFSANDLPTHRVIHKLHLAEATYHRHRNAAIHALGETLLQQAKPALRLEQVTEPPLLVGRAERLAAVMDALRVGKSVSLSGPGGVGKTALGRAAARQIAPQATFWYTISPALNDRSHPVLFALAWFLHSHGASTLWSQLVADRGECKQEIALNLLRHDCANLAGQNVDRPLLFCFDEVDLIHPDESEAHAQLMALLGALPTFVTCLFIGQKSVLATDLHLPLTGLAAPQIAQFLQQAGLPLADADVGHLQAYTQGNPRLLELFVAFTHALQRTEEREEAHHAEEQSEQPVKLAATAATTALTYFTQEPSVEFLLRRIWQHLNESEMVLLELLAVMRNPVPRSACNDQAQQAATDQLVTWHLVQSDGHGTMQLLPAFRTAIYGHLLAGEEKELLHLEAAAIRAGYGQFAAAAHHYAAAGEPAVAIHLLYTYKEETINQGQATAALTVLTQISQRRLDQETQEILTLLRAELQKLLGHYDKANAALRSIQWRIPFLSAQRWRVEGDIAELRGEVGHAQTAYQNGLTTIETLLSESALFHRDMGYLYTNDVDFAKAEQEVARIRHEAANLEGFLCEMRGDLAAAEVAYTSALALAQAVDYYYGEANTQNNLGRIYGWQRQLTAAEATLQAAITFFQQTGQLNKLASATYNLALARRLAKEYGAALAPATEALQWFTQLGESYGTAVTLGQHHRTAWSYSR